MEACVRARVSQRGICGGQGDIGTGFPSSPSVSPRQYDSTRGSPYLYIIWGMNNRPVGDRSSETFSHPVDINIGTEWKDGQQN
jgi:hypothetical protein